MTYKTFGLEVEWGDIPRSVEIPAHLGQWDCTEVDVLNLRPPYRYQAADPLGTRVPVGGEINTFPSQTIEEQVEKVRRIKALFNEEPTICCTDHTHVHIRVPEMLDNIELLKKLVRYIGANQGTIAREVGGFTQHPEMKSLKGATRYMKYDGGLLMPQWMVENIVEQATDVESFIKLHQKGKAGLAQSVNSRPYRYAINTYSIKGSGTVEFRFFRGTTDVEQIAQCLRFADRVIEEALGDQTPAEEILSSEQWDFPPFRWNPFEWVALQATHFPKVPKKRYYVDIDQR
jgi:hypothetical protein